MAAAETLAAGDDIVKALDILTEARKLPDGVSFADLGDRQTMSSFDAAGQFAGYAHHAHPQRQKPASRPREALP